MIESVERVSLLITDRLKSPVRCVIGEDTVKLFCTTTMGRATDQISAKFPETSLKSVSITNICSMHSAQRRPTKFDCSSADRSARCSFCRRRATRFRSSSCRCGYAAKCDQCFTYCLLLADKHYNSCETSTCEVLAPKFKV